MTFEGQYINDFVSFLHENDCYDSFLKNCELNRARLGEDSKCYSIIVRLSTIDNGFVWSKTEQGHAYWSNIHRDWSDTWLHLKKTKQ